MNSKDNYETNEPSGLIEDLSVRNDDEVKGGPIYLNYEGVEGDVTSSSAASAAGGGGGGAGKVQMQDWHFVVK